MQKVTSDLFDIANRLREIDNRYVTFFNPERERFEVHTSEITSTDSLAFIVTDPILDERTLWKARVTRVDNFDNLMDEFDIHNRELERKAERGLNHAIRQLTEMFDFASQTSHDVTFSKRRQI